MNFDEFEQENINILHDLTHQERIFIYKENMLGNNINEAIEELQNEKDLEYEY